MGTKATRIYRNHPELLNTHTYDDLKAGDPFMFPGLEQVDSRSQSRGIHKKKGAKVIIAGSGMMMGGRIVGHAAHYLPISTTRLLIVGYQGEGTLGRELMEGATQVNIEGKTVKVNGTVNDTQSMSSHADQQQLLDWLAHIKNVKKVILTHGEDNPREVLAGRITKELGIGGVVTPHLHDEVTL
jgi:metallo-beta-lactamase family protein